MIDTGPFRDSGGVCQNGAQAVKEKKSHHYDQCPGFYKSAGRFLKYVAFNTWFRGSRITLEEPIPDTGPLYFFYNHVSNWDPGVVGALVSNRRLNYPAKKELFMYDTLSQRVKSWILSHVGSIPFDRENMVNSRENLKYVKQLLEEGEGVAVAPEGQRNKDFFATRRLLDFKLGFIKLLISTQSSFLRKGRTPIRVFPLAINYLPNFDMGSRILVRVGKSIPIDEYVKLHESGRKDEAAEMLSQRVRVQLERLIVKL